MLCPCCKSEMVKGGMCHQKSIMEYGEHDTGAIRDFYICSNDSCFAFDNLRWSAEGELYVAHNDYENRLSVIRTLRDGDIFIDDNDAPFGTMFRQINAIHDTRDTKRLNLKYLWIDLEWKKEANRNGEILMRRPKLRFWVYDKKTGGMSGYIPGISMLWHCVSRFERARKALLTESHHAMDEIIQTLRDEHAVLATWDKRWWSKLSKTYCKWRINMLEKT